MKAEKWSDSQLSKVECVRENPTIHNVASYIRRKNASATVSARINHEQLAAYYVW
jgi:hypothetical protein